MATRNNKEKCAHIKGMKNELLSQLVVNTKRRKLHEDKGKTVVSLSIPTIPSSSTPYLEVMAITPPTTRLKKEEEGKSVLDDLVIALGRAHNVIIDDELKCLTSIPSH